jgi:hypothetical protein
MPWHSIYCVYYILDINIFVHYFIGITQTITMHKEENELRCLFSQRALFQNRSHEAKFLPEPRSFRILKGSDDGI